jgi:uncharacterized delta-60 repeat protein
MARSRGVPAVCGSVVLAVLLGTGDIRARDGDPDADFGSLGSLILPFPGDLPVAEGFIDVHALPDGKLLVSATVLNGKTAAGDFGVMRLHADGTVDTDFGDGGARIVGFDRPGSDHFDTARSLAVQPDGRILVVGEAAGGIGGLDMAVIRLTADGSLDPGFGMGGKTTVAFDLGASPQRRADQGVRIAVRPDGRIMVAGVASTAAGAQMAVVRLTTGGVLDTSFDGDGKRTIDFGGGLADVSLAYKLLITADGQRTYAVGVAGLTGNPDYAVSRLLNGGGLDSAFGGDGTVTYGFDIAAPFGDIATGAVEFPDGKLLLCGASVVTSPGNTDISCMRMLENGTVDADFPPVLIPFNLGGTNADESIAMQVDDRGRILLAGYAPPGENTYDTALVRMLPSGQVDPSFGVDGRMTYDAEWQGEPGLFNRAHSMAVQADGKIVLAGSAQIPPSFAYYVQIIRVMADGLFNDGFELPAL